MVRGTLAVKAGYRETDLPSTMTQLAFPLNGAERFVLYEDRPEYHLLLLNIPPDNRFTPDTIPAILQAVTYIRTKGDPKPLITTSTTPKFFSNGLDYETAVRTPGFFDQHYYPLMRVFLEFPWPTVALVNGHAFAAGFMIAECHDYIVMNPSKGFLCMNELAFGAPLMGPLMSIFRVRFGTQTTHRITLTAHRFTAQEALEAGLITAKGGLTEAESIAKRVAKLSESPSYGAIRKELFREVIRDLKSYDSEALERAENEKFEDDFYNKIAGTLKSKI